MTVKAFRLENFMAFADTGWIEFRPITLLFGRNSSGKSAIIRALRLLRQSLQTSPDKPLCFVDEYGVDVGGYLQIAHGYDPANVDPPPEVSFHFRCYTPEILDNVRDLLNEWKQGAAIIATPDDFLMLSLTFGHDSDPDRQAELRSLQLGCSWNVGDEPDQHLLLAAYRFDVEDRIDFGYEWWFSTDLSSLAELSWKQATVTLTDSFLPGLDNSPLPILSDIWTKLCHSVRTFLEGLEWLGPTRPEPKRAYALDEITRQGWRQQGWGAFLDFLEGKLDDGKLIQIDGWLQHLELGEQIYQPVKKYPAGGNYDKDAMVAKIEIEEQESKPLVNLKDVGYGASQVIPVIVQGVTARQRVKADTSVHMIIEQPELHLHPRAQARLADLFVNEIYTLPDPLPRNFNLLSYLENSDSLSKVNFLLETHSEDLLLRLRRRIAETSAKQYAPLALPDRYLLPNNVSIYFVRRSISERTSSVTEIPIGKFGELTKKPEGFAGFFSTDLQELSAITSAKLESPE